jgi:hypothetical protein
MLVFTNLEPTSTFSVFLAGKLVYPESLLYLVLTRQADLVPYTFVLENESTSINYYTFTIQSDNLPSGDYDFKVFNGDYISDNVDCLIDFPINIQEAEFYACNPVTIETYITLEDIIQVGIGVQAVNIMTGKARVFGTEQVFITNQSNTNYVVYEG